MHHWIVETDGARLAEHEFNDSNFPDLRKQPLSVSYYTLANHFTDCSGPWLGREYDFGCS